MTVMAVDSTGTSPHRAIEETLQGGGTVRIAFENSEAADRQYTRLKERYAHPNLVRHRPLLPDWNETLQWDAICTRDMKRADRELAKKWEENGPPMAFPMHTPRAPSLEQSRAPMREQKRDQGPDRGSRYER